MTMTQQSRYLNRNRKRVYI